MQDRLQKLLKDKNLTSSEFARKIGVQASTISHILSGRNKPGYDMIHSILTVFPDISPGWLITGHGPMYVREETQTIEKKEDTGSLPFAEPPAPVVRPASGKGEPPAPAGKKVRRIVIYYDDHYYEEFFPPNS